MLSHELVDHLVLILGGVPSLGSVGMSGDVLVHSSAAGHLCAYSHSLGVSGGCFQEYFQVETVAIV